MTATSLEKLSPRTNYDLIGHNENINFILNCYKKKRLHQAYLFSGNEGIGKATFAYSFSRFLLSDASLDSFSVNKNDKVSRLIESNTHPDLLVIEPNKEKKDRFISIDQARKCSEFFNHTPSISKWRVCIIDSIDFMDISTSNTILKILEEPPSYCIFLIIAQKVDAVIGTIRSRCVEIRFKDIEEDIEDGIFTPASFMGDREARRYVAACVFSGCTSLKSITLPNALHIPHGILPLNVQLIRV